jgi:Cu/Zn superoxide dismutase
MMEKKIMGGKIITDVNTLDLTHSTGTQAIVSFHVHKHGNCGNVTKASNDIGMEGEEAF